MKSHSYDSVCRAGLKTTGIKREQIEVRDHLLNVKYIRFSDMYTQDFPSEFISTVEVSDRHFEIVSQTKYYGNTVESTYTFLTFINIDTQSFNISYTQSFTTIACNQSVPSTRIGVRTNVQLVAKG